MFAFLLKGILRDRSRTIFPILVVGAGVLIIVFLLAFMQGYIDSMVRQNARFDTGHLKIVTNAYAELINQKPYDLGFLDIKEDLATWKKAYPELSFVQRINFAALLDVPDAQGNTRAQGDVGAFAIDLGLGADHDPDLPDIQNLHLHDALEKGRLPELKGEILISDKAFERLELALGDTITLIGSTVHGAMSFQNFSVCGTLIFGLEALDRGGLVADISDIRTFLDMEDGVAEILAFDRSGKYNPKKLQVIKDDFNRRFSDPVDEFAPQMLLLSDQNNLAAILYMTDATLGIITMVFIIIMGIVLWNSGLMNCIRRYGEIGVRLAMGEQKRQLYFSLIVESVFIGLIGSLVGTMLGLGICAYFNKYGMDVSAYNRESTFISENIIYTSISLKSALWGFVPGVLSTVLGAMLAGLVIFKRKTAQLFKELEI